MLTRFKKMAKKTRVKIIEQWRDFDNQAEARAWAMKLLASEVIFLTVNGAEDEQ